MTQWPRRSFLAAPAAALAASGEWDKLAAAFPVDRSIANFNHAGVGTTATPVSEAVVKRMWEGEKLAPGTIFSYGPELDKLRLSLAQLAGCDGEEIAIVRNATEALDAVLLGFPLKAGDEVVTTSLDYWAMLDALEQRQERDGALIRKVDVPTVPRSMDDLLAPIERAMTSRTKLVLVSHPINLNGQLLPIQRMSQMAHARGAEVVVDAAQSFGLFPYSVKELGCDYLGTSLHKWLMGPKGTGMLYVKREKIEKIWPLFASGGTKPKNDIRKFELYGTWPETILALDAAIAFHKQVGPERKAARLRELTLRWVKAIEKLPRVELHTNTEMGMSWGIATVGIRGKSSAELRRWLYEDKQILTMDVSRRTKQFSGVRISCGLATQDKELDKLIAALKEAAA
jgi:selenocysteine lyase/cysteine desulfurase